MIASGARTGRAEEPAAFGLRGDEVRATVAGRALDPEVLGADAGGSTSGCSAGIARGSGSTSTPTLGCSTATPGWLLGRSAGATRSSTVVTPREGASSRQAVATAIVTPATAPANPKPQAQAQRRRGADGGASVSTSCASVDGRRLLATAMDRRRSASSSAKSARTQRATSECVASAPTSRPNASMCWAMSSAD